MCIENSYSNSNKCSLFMINYISYTIFLPKGCGLKKINIYE